MYKVNVGDLLQCTAVSLTLLTQPNGLNSVHSTQYTVHCSLYTVHCTLYIVQYTLFSEHCILYTHVLYSFSTSCRDLKELKPKRINFFLNKKFIYPILSCIYLHQTCMTCIHFTLLPCKHSLIGQIWNLL